MKNKKLITVFIISAILAFVVTAVGKNVWKSITIENDQVLKIQNILEDHCDCITIEKNMYAKGVQYSNDQGFTTEMVDFILTDCNYDNLREEGTRLEKLIKGEGLENFSMITLDYISDQKQETIVIKNGKLQ